MTATIVQSVAGLGQSAGLTLTFPSPVTIGNTLVVLQLRRQGAPHPPNTSGIGNRWGPGAWTELASVECVRDGNPSDINGVTAHAKIADATNQSGDIYIYTQAVAFELSGVPDLSALSVISQDTQSSSATQDIGSLGVVATGDAAMLIVGLGVDGTSVTVTHPNWTRSLYACRDSDFGGDSGGGAFPYGWMGYATGAGVSLEAQVTTSSAHQWAGIAVHATGTPPPVASFTEDPDSGLAPLPVDFTDTSTGTPTSWAWNFGDGDTSSTQDPSHTYTTPGTYLVRLTVSNAGGSDTAYGIVTATQETLADSTLTFREGWA